jgi:hypothetical protein
MGRERILEAGIVNFFTGSFLFSVVFDPICSHAESIHDALNDLSLSSKVLLGLFRDIHHPF